MSKPLGVALVGDAGGVGLRVSHPSRAEDAIWEAVRLAQDEAWSPKQFMREVSAAWEEILTERAKDEAKEFDK